MCRRSMVGMDTELLVATSQKIILVINYTIDV